jgi:hypothetical protein
MSDPNETLARLREAVSEWEDERGDGTPQGAWIHELFDQARDAFTDLDTWLSAPKRGYLPSAWQHVKGWALVQRTPAEYHVQLNGKTVQTVSYDGRGWGSNWGMYTTEFGYERHHHPTDCMRVVMDRYEGKS